jgi:SAM-dependent methyltransferase
VYLERLRLNRRAVSELLRQAALQRPTVVELGCGVGGIANWLAEQGANVTAVDTSKAAIQVAQERSAGLPHPPEYRCADVSRLAWNGPQVDLVLAFDVVEHLPPALLPHLLSVVRAMLAETGLFLLTTPNRVRLGNRVRRWLGRPPSLYEAHQREYDLGELTRLLEGAGLSPRRVRGLYAVDPHYTHGRLLVHHASLALGHALPRWADSLAIVAGRGEVAPEVGPGGC